MKKGSILKLMIHILVLLWILITFINLCQLIHIKKVFIPFLEALIPLILGLVLSVLLDPIILFLEKRKIPRKFSCFFVYFSVVIVMVGVIRLAYPEMMHQYHAFINALPEYQKALDHFINQENMMILKNIPLQNQIGEVVNTSLSSLSSFLSSFVSGIGTLLIGFSAALYLSLEKNHFTRMIKERFKKKNSLKILRYGQEIAWITRCFFKAMILDTLFFFLLAYLGLNTIGMSQAFSLALFLALTNLIPYIGPYIGGIPVILLGLMHSQDLFIKTLVLVLGVQYIESTFVQPFLFYRHIHIHPLASIFGITFFGSLFGFIGMILSPLILAYLQWVFRLSRTEFF